MHLHHHNQPLKSPKYVMNINSTRQHAFSIHLAGLEPLWQPCSAGLRSLTKFTLGLFSWCSCNPMKNVKDSREPDKVQLQPVRTPPKAACLCVKEKEQKPWIFCGVKQVNSESYQLFQKKHPLGVNTGALCGRLECFH